MAFKFRHALFVAGAFLIVFGMLALASGSLPSPSGPSVLEAFSQGIDSIFMALFSGVLIGIGIAMVGNGLMLQVMGDRRHFILSMLSSLFFLSLSAVVVLTSFGAPLLTLLLSFSFIFASATFLFTSLWYALAALVHKYVFSH
jgi:uncharacterized membrane protein YidH (DUF202 family)